MRRGQNAGGDAAGGRGKLGGELEQHEVESNEQRMSAYWGEAGICSGPAVKLKLLRLCGETCKTPGRHGRGQKGRWREEGRRGREMRGEEA